MQCMYYVQSYCLSIRRKIGKLFWQHFCSIGHRSTFSKLFLLTILSLYIAGYRPLYPDGQARERHEQCCWDPLPAVWVLASNREPKPDAPTHSSKYSNQCWEEQSGAQPLTVKLL